MPLQTHLSSNSLHEPVFPLLYLWLYFHVASVFLFDFNTSLCCETACLACFINALSQLDNPTCSTCFTPFVYSQFESSSLSKIYSRVSCVNYIIFICTSFLSESHPSVVLSSFNLISLLSALLSSTSFLLSLIASFPFVPGNHLPASIITSSLPSALTTERAAFLVAAVRLFL